MTMKRKPRPSLRNYYIDKHAEQLFPNWRDVKDRIVAFDLYDFASDLWDTIERNETGFVNSFGGAMLSPYNDAWFEYAISRQGGSCVYGVYCFTQKANMSAGAWEMDPALALAEDTFGPSNVERSRWDPPNFAAEDRPSFIQCAGLYACPPEAHFLIAVMAIYLDQEGKQIGRARCYPTPFFWDAMRATGQDLKDGQLLCQREVLLPMAPFLCALYLLHIKNVEAGEFPAEQKVRDKLAKKRGTSATRVKHLFVRLPRIGKVPLADIGRNTDQGQMAWHSVMRHVKDYTQGKGLFGKYHIKVWVPPHYRGDKANGQIDKDYGLRFRK